MSEQRTAPWQTHHFYRVDGIPMVYETLVGGVLATDIIIDYEGRKWAVDELKAAGHRVDKPAIPRGVKMGLAA